MPISFFFEGKKSKNLKDLGDIFINRINQIANDAFRVGKVGDLIVKFFSGIMVEQILTEGKRGNTPYEKLSRNRPGGGILNKTGQLIQDIKKLKVSKVTRNKQETIKIMVNNTYGFLHQIGTKNMFDRPILVLTNKDKEKLREIVIESFTKANKKKFGAK